MRKSLAPSQRNKLQQGNNCGPSTSTSQIPALTSITATAPLTPKENVLDAKTAFSVVYGKPTKKKHRTWECDGVLEVGCLTATLKDSEGKVVSQTSAKNKDFSEGSRLFVGFKEVQIIERLAEPSSRKRSAQEALDCKPLTPSPFAKMKKTNVINKVTNSKKPPSDALIMPKPCDQHQWMFNEGNLPVNEVIVDNSLCRVLRPHQREGVLFLYQCITGIRSYENMGAILADEMGLGKTLQCITVIWTLLRQAPYGNIPLLKRVLIVTPCSLVKNWGNEFIKWIGSYRIQVFMVDKNNKPRDYVKHPLAPVFIISYEMLMRCHEELGTLKFDLIVCDEGHRLKNSGIRCYSLLNALNCKRRILLTGTPLQNDLQEFFTLVDFVNPGFLGSASEFRKNFENVIVSSREQNSSKDAVDKGLEKAEELSQLTQAFILRRTSDVLGDFLPKKTEYVVFFEPTLLQKNLYKLVVDYWDEVMAAELRENLTSHLSLMTFLKKICNHPHLLINNDESSSEESLAKKLSSELSGKDFAFRDSSKMAAVSDLLNNIAKSREKIILASNFTQTLDLFEKLCKRGAFQYLRFDGSTPAGQRNEIVRRFNDSSSREQILLLSCKAGGVGLNLIGASRLVLFDSDWNPANDLQVMARVWREGQRKCVHVYRFLTSGTIEEKIFQRQLNKTGLGNAIIDPECSSVKLSTEELKDIFSYSEGDSCLTHSALNCFCTGDGSIPGGGGGGTEDAELEADWENIKSKKSYKMNELYQWEHHCAPVDSTLIEDMMLNNVSTLINFVFKNQSAGLCS